MRTRAITTTDAPILEAWAKSSGFPYIEPKEAFVVVDDEDHPIMACSPHQIIELYLWSDPSRTPALKLHALRMLHDTMIPEMKARGITEVNAFLPPDIERKFGRRLVRTFQWVRNWTSYCKLL